jgi:hypothetical protein
MTIRLLIWLLAFILQAGLLGRSMYGVSIPCDLNDDLLWTPELAHT